MNISTLSSAFRALSFSSASSALRVQAVRTMAVKAGASAAASKPSKAKKESAPKKSEKASKSKKAAAIPKPKLKKIAALPMPKRPSTSWSLFFVEHLDKVRASGQNVIPTKESAVAAAHWKEMTDAQKQVYKDRYEANMAEFKRQTEGRLQELTPAEYKIENSRRQALRAAGKKGLPSLKDPNAPKRPLSSFFRFAQDQRGSGKYSHLPLKEQANAFADAWTKVSGSEKARYTELSRTALEAYKKEKAAYEAQYK
ncbi:exp1-like protein [Mortierella sp. GBA30]|nr:exp1-like protein [Mortierella sp. GBA30]